MTRVTTPVLRDQRAALVTHPAKKQPEVRTADLHLRMDSCAAGGNINGLGGVDGGEGVEGDPGGGGGQGGPGNNSAGINAFIVDNSMATTPLWRLQFLPAHLDLRFHLLRQFLRLHPARHAVAGCPIAASGSSATIASSPPSPPFAVNE